MRHTLHVLLRSCRESCCAAVFVVCCTASFAQGVPEPLSDQSVIQQLDSLRGLEVAFPDTLQSVFDRADSIRTAFNVAADSLKSQRARVITSIAEQERRIKTVADSLRELGLDTDQYAEPLRRLNSLKADTERGFSEKFDALKSGTTDKLSALDLPDEYRKPVDELMGKIKSVGLEKGSVDIPGFRVPGIELPDIDVGSFDIPEIGLETVDVSTIGLPDELGKLGDAALPGSEFGELAGQAAEYQEAIEDIESLKEISDMPQGLEKQMDRVDGLQELQEQSQVIDQYKSQVADVQDTEKVKAKAIDEGRKAAVDHFAGKQEQLKGAMEQLSKYKQKYHSVASIKDLPKRPPNPMKRKPFVERLVPGLMLQYQRKNAYLLDLNPYVGYRLSGRFTVGVGWNHRYAYISDARSFDSRLRIFGPRSYVDFKLGKGFIARLEGETMNTFVPSTLWGNPDSGAREWVWGCMTGIKKEYRIYKNLKGTALIQYNIFDPHHKAPYVDRVNSRIGFEYTIKRKLKSSASRKE